MSNNDTILDQNGGQDVSESEVGNIPEGELEAQMPSAEQDQTEESNVEDSLPEDSSERTRKEFEKLKESNRKLKEQLEARQTYGDSVYDSLYGNRGSNPQAFTQKEVNQVASNYIDEYGNVDVQGLNRALNEARETAERAAELAQRASLDSRRRDEQRQVMEAHSKHPWLNPNSPDFDPRGYQLVRDRAVANLASGRELPLAAIADEILDVYTPSSVKTNTGRQAVDEYKESQAKKVQASTTKGRGQPRQESAPIEDLRMATRKGDERALDERIRLATGG